MSNEEWQKLFYRGQWNRQIIEAPLESIVVAIKEVCEDMKEENTMKVSYKGVTGSLGKLELSEGWGKTHHHYMAIPPSDWIYDMEIIDTEKGCLSFFPNISLKDVKFLGGEVTYG